MKLMRSHQFAGDGYNSMTVLWPLLAPMAVEAVMIIRDDGNAICRQGGVSPLGYIRCYCYVKNGEFASNDSGQMVTTQRTDRHFRFALWWLDENK